MRKLKSRKQGKGEKQNGITEEKGKRKGEEERERERAIGNLCAPTSPSVIEFP